MKKLTRKTSTGTDDAICRNEDCDVCEDYCPLFCDSENYCHLFKEMTDKLAEYERLEDQLEPGMTIEILIDSYLKKTQQGITGDILPMDESRGF